MPRCRFAILCAALIGATSLASSSRAVVLNGATPRNVSAPIDLAHLSLWNLQGDVGGFLGTPIGPRAFIAADHAFGGLPSITHGITTRATGSSSLIAGTDLRVYTLASGAPSFTTWAPLWNESVDGSEVGRPTVTFGRGRQRGATVYFPAAGTTPIGFAWGADDRVRSWGVDSIDSLASSDNVHLNFIAVDFKGTGTDEFALSGGDSSGAMFVRTPGGTWKLAGINYGVDVFNYASGIQPGYVQASIYDARGMYEWGGPSAPGIYVDPGTHPDPVPMKSYASRISHSYDSLVPFVPEPTTTAALLLIAMSALKRK